MNFDDSGRTRTVAVVALLLALVAVVALGGLALGAMDSGADERSGEEILSDVEETYSDADSVSSEAVVTIEALDRTTQFEVSAAAAGDDRMRVNVSKNGVSVVTGVDDGTVWRYDSVTGLTGVVDRDGETVTVSLRAGTEAPAQSGLSALPGGIGLDTELSTVVGAFDGELPEGFEGELEDLPANATIGDVLANDSLAGDIDRSALTGGSEDLPEGFEEVNLGEFDFPENLSEFELPEKFEEVNLGEFEFPENLSEFELPEKFEEVNLGEFEFSENLSEFELPEKFEEFEFSKNLSGYEPPENWNRSVLRERINESLTGGFNSSAVTVERVGTTTIDGTEANKLLLSHPETESETRLWTDAESDTVLKQETTAPGVTVTVDVEETRFGVSPADSTFEPPGATELASLSLSTTESPSTFESSAPFETAVPGGDWRFERGAVLSGEAPSLTAATGFEAGDIAAAKYTDDGSTLVVGQSGDVVDLERIPEFVVETETVGDREVRLLTTRYASAGVFTEDGTTVVVAGDLTGSELRAAIESIDR
jgi:outer membrane lipoprotein-sorting protein